MCRQPSYCTPLYCDLNLTNTVVHELHDQVHGTNCFRKLVHPGPLGKKKKIVPIITSCINN